MKKASWVICAAALASIGVTSAACGGGSGEPAAEGTALEREGPIAAPPREPAVEDLVEDPSADGGGEASADAGDAGPPRCGVDVDAVGAQRADVRVAQGTLKYGVLIRVAKCSARGGTLSLDVTSGAANTPELVVDLPSTSGTFSGPSAAVQYTYSERMSVLRPYESFTHSQAKGGACTACVISSPTEIAARISCKGLTEATGRAKTPIDVDADVVCTFDD
jgi:hypothetical protein